MLKISELAAGRTNGVSNKLSDLVGRTRMLGLLLFLALIHDPVPARSVTFPANSVALAWDRSASAEVAGYRVYYGAASGIYTNSVMVGNVSTNTVSGLAPGTAYFFVVTAYDAAGLESLFSNETTYTVPTSAPTVQIRLAPNQQVILTVNGQSGHTYEIQATPALPTWTTIGTVTLGPSGAIDFLDPSAASFPSRFYRARDTQP